MYQRLLILALLLLPLPLAAKPIVADMSDYRISISSDFAGKRMLLFGARNDPGDVMVVVRGPERVVTLRKKEQVMGVWVNGSQVTYSHVPFFYAITGTRPIAELPPSPLYRQLNIGVNQLQFTPIRKPRGEDDLAHFQQAFIAHQQKRGLYQDFARPVTFMGETLFKTVIPFPDTLPRGDYAVDIYLIAGGSIQSVQTLPIRVEKVGFDAFVYDSAHDHPWLYGLAAVLIAVGFGWLVSLVFNRLW